MILPEEIVNKIYSYISHPIADIMRGAINDYNKLIVSPAPGFYAYALRKKFYDSINVFWY
jgi:hypothetical protein